MRPWPLFSSSFLTSEASSVILRLSAASLRLRRQTQLRAEEIHDKLWDSGFSARCDAGAYSGDDMYEQIGQRLGVTLPRRDVCRLWSLAFEPHAEVLAMAAAVRRHLPIGLLTDNPPLLREALPGFLPELEQSFDVIIFSYQHGVCKPDPTLYEAAAQSVGAAASATLLIDDSQTNVQGAAASGWQAIHFTTSAALRQALSDLGLSDMEQRRSASRNNIGES